MEILAETTLWGLYLAALIPVLISMIACAAVTIDSIIDKDVSNSIVLISTTSFIVLLLTILLIEGPPVEYYAIVTDHNEVYSQGYEVDRQEGELTILTKRSR